jgi:hypothetical protein
MRLTIPARAPLALLLLAAAASAQAGTHFTPVGSGGAVNAGTSFHQDQVKVAVRPDGQRIVYVWSSDVPYHDVFARLFDGQGQPLTPDIQVNANIAGKSQDEPTVAMDEHGNFLVAWSDRNGLDGSGMGVYGRCFDASGAPWGPDAILSQTTLQSQWEPFACARPGGGFVVGWSGNDDGKCFLRLFDEHGAPASAEVRANALDSNAQTDPVPAVARDGTIFVAWIDFGGYGGAGTGTNIFARLFSPALVPLQAQEFPVNTSTLAGEQREPKTAADGLGRFVVTWEDRQQDANGIDIWARRYDTSGAALGPEFQVNTTQLGDQVFPAVACDWVGNFVVCWEDRSAASSVVRAQRFDAQGAPLGAEFVVHTPVGGSEGYPDVELDWAGELFAFCYDTPDAGGKTDAGARRWHHAPLTQLGAATPGGSFSLQLDLPGGAGLWRMVLLALGTQPGLPLPDGRKLELSFDPLFSFVLTTPGGGGAFSGFTGLLGPSASATSSVSLPGNGALVGLVLQSSVVTLDLAGVGLAQQLRHVAHPLAITIQ